MIFVTINLSILHLQEFNHSVPIYNPYLTLFLIHLLSVEWTTLNGKNYWVSEEAASQADATNKCNEMDGYLAEPVSAKENEGIVKMMSDKGIGYAWIGVDDIAKEANNNGNK